MILKLCRTDFISYLCLLLNYLKSSKPQNAPIEVVFVFWINASSIKRPWSSSVGVQVVTCFPNRVKIICMKAWNKLKARPRVWQPLRCQYICSIKHPTPSCQYKMWFLYSKREARVHFTYICPCDRSSWRRSFLFSSLSRFLSDSKHQHAQR